MNISGFLLLRENTLPTEPQAPSSRPGSAGQRSPRVSELTIMAHASCPPTTLSSTRLLTPMAHTDAKHFPLASAKGPEYRFRSTLDGRRGCRLCGSANGTTGRERERANSPLSHAPLHAPTASASPSVTRPTHDLLSPSVHATNIRSP